MDDESRQHAVTWLDKIESGEVKCNEALMTLDQLPLFFRLNSFKV